MQNGSRQLAAKLADGRFKPRASFAVALLSLYSINVILAVFLVSTLPHVITITR